MVGPFDYCCVDTDDEGPRKDNAAISPIHRGSCLYLHVNMTIPGLNSVLWVKVAIADRGIGMLFE